MKSSGGVDDSSSRLGDPDMPPATKRPKFISTFGPASDDTDVSAGSHSIVPLIRDEADSISTVSKARNSEPTPQSVVQEANADEADSHSTMAGSRDEGDRAASHSAMLEDGSNSLDRHATESLDEDGSGGLIPFTVVTEESVLESSPEKSAAVLVGHTAVSMEQAVSESGPDRKSSAKGEVSMMHATTDSKAMDVDAKSMLTEEALHNKSPPQVGMPAAAQETERQVEVKDTPMDVPGSSSTATSDERTTSSPRKLKVSKKSKDAIGSKSKSPNIKRVIKIKRAKSPKLAKTLPEASCSDETSDKPSLSSWAAFADAAMEENEPCPPVSKNETVKSPPTEITMETAPMDSSERDSRENIFPMASASSKEDGGAPVSTSSLVVSSEMLSPDNVTPDPVDRLKISQPDGSSTHRRHHHHHHKRSGKLDDKLFGKLEKEAKQEDELSGKPSSSKMPQECKGGGDSGIPSASKEGKKDVEGRIVKESRKEVEGGAAKVKMHRSSRKNSPHGLSTIEKERLRGGEVEKTKHSRNYSDSDDSAAFAPCHSQSAETRPYSSLPPQGSQEQPKMSPIQQAQAHSPLGIAVKDSEKDFSPLSDDDFPKAASISRHSAVKESRPMKWTEDEDWKLKTQKRHQGGVDDSSIPSPASSLGSSGSKKHHHRHHHHHHERSSAATPAGDPHYLPPILPSQKHDHHSSDSRSSPSRGLTPERSKRHHHHHHHHHHRSSGGSDRHHHTHEGGRGRNPSHHHHPTASSSTVKGDLKRTYESISDDDLFRDREEDHLSRRSLHDGSKSSSSRKRRRISSDSAEGTGDPLPISSESRGGYSGSGSYSSSKHKKAKKHSKDHKERWKEGGSSSKHKQHSHK